MGEYFRHVENWEYVPHVFFRSFLQVHIPFLKTLNTICTWYVSVLETFPTLGQSHHILNLNVLPIPRQRPWNGCPNRENGEERVDGVE